MRRIFPGITCLLLCLFIFSGCSYFIGSRIPDCLLNKTDLGVLKKYLLSSKSLPGFKPKFVSQAYPEIAGPIEEKDKVYILKEQWQSSKDRFTLTYFLYPSPEKARKSFKSMVSSLPLGMDPNSAKNPHIWETHAGEVYRLYLHKDRLIFYLEGKDKDLLYRAADMLLTPQ